MGNYKDCRVLVIEENMINRRIMTQFLKSFGCDVVAVSSGSEAIKECESSDFSAVFTDMLMSGLDGYETASKIKSIDRCKDIVIVAVSSSDDLKLTAKMKKAGIDHLISKPVQKTDIDKILSSSKPTGKVFMVKEFEAFFGDESLRQEIVNTFLEEEKSDAKRVKDAFKKNTSEEVYKAVHYMKGSFGYLKATPIFDVSKIMCDFIKEGKFEEAIKYKDEFLKLYEELIVELKFYARSF